jgi:hemolysin activation/secretion protein
MNCGMEIESKEYGYMYGNLKLLDEFNSFWYAGLGLEYNETSETTDSTENEGSYYGIDFLLLKIPERFSRGILSNEITIDIGSGIARKDKHYTRSHIDFSIGSHFPLWHSQAVVARLVTAHIVSKEKELLPVEMNRVGGYSSIRGYSENQFAFRTVGYLQLEGIHYFSSNGSIFIFTDGGIGFKDEPGIKSEYTRLLGYGLGIRIPSRLGLMTLEWARNLQDKKSPGRVHIQFQNDLSLKTGKFL